MEKKNQVIELFAIFGLVFMLYLTFITMTRTCEVLEGGEIKKITCSEIGYYEK